MTGKGDEQENVQKKKTRLQAHILLLFRKHDKHASHSRSGVSRNSPLDHVFPDEAAKIFLIVNPVVQKRNIILRLESLRSKKRDQHRQKNKRRHHHCDQGVTGKYGKPSPDVFQGTFFNYMKIFKSCIKHHEYPDHIEKVKVGNSCKCYRPDKNIWFLFSVYLIDSHEHQGKINHGIGEIRMFHGGVARPSRKNIDKDAEKYGLSGIFMVKTVPGKRDTRKIDPQKYQRFIENLRMFCRHKYGKQSQGISDHIIVERRQDIRSVSDIHIPHGDCRIMIYKYGFQDISQISAVIRQGVQMLGNAVMAPYQRFSVQVKMQVQDQRQYCEYQRIGSIKISSLFI